MEKYLEQCKHILSLPHKVAKQEAISLICNCLINKDKEALACISNHLGVGYYNYLVTEINFILLNK